MVLRKGWNTRRVAGVGSATALPIACLVVFGLVVPDTVHAGSSDQRRALEALKAGRIVSLREMLDDIEARYSGDILEVELDDHHDVWVYDIKLITPQGNVLKLRVDATTKEILRIKGRGIEKARKK